MNSSPEATTWHPSLDLTPTGLSQFDPARVKDAIERGYRAGLRAGEAAAAEAARVAAEAEAARQRDEAGVLLASIARLATTLEDATAAAAETFATSTVDTALRLAEAIVQRELSDPVVAARDALRRALADIDRADAVVVRVNPADHDRLAGATLPANLTLEADPSLAPGDAIARAGARTVDARIADAIDRARAVLAGAA